MITTCNRTVKPDNSLAGEKRTLARLLAPLDQIAAHSPNLVTRRTSQFEVGGERYEIPNYVFIGPEAQHPPVRLAFFSGLHGNELEGSVALTLLVQLLEALPELARGYCLFLYPACNPTGYEDGSYLSRERRDLNQEFWKGSSAPEVRVLEGELKSQTFDGIITLHSNHSEKLFYGISPQPLVTDRLVRPALQAVDRFSTRGERRPYFQVQKSFTRNQPGALSLPVRSENGPFEIILEAPQAEAAWLLVAVLSILEEHKKAVVAAHHS